MYVLLCESLELVPPTSYLWLKELMLGQKLHLVPRQRSVHHVPGELSTDLTPSFCEGRCKNPPA